MDYEEMQGFWDARPQVLAISLVFSVLPVAAITLRFWARGKRNNLDASDYLALASTILTVVFWILEIIISWGDPNEHTARLPYDIDEFASKCVFVSLLVWVLAIYLCKLSILVLYYKLFAHTPTPTWILRIAIVVVACACVANILSYTLALQPISLWWSFGSDPEAEIVTVLHMNLGMDVLTLITDVLTFTLAVIMIGGLRSSRNERTGLLIVFALGFLTCVEVIVRMIAFYALDVAVSQLWMSQLLTGLEPSLGVTISSLPLMRNLFKCFEPRGSDEAPSNFISFGRTSMKAKPPSRDPDLELLESREDLVIDDNHA